MKKIILFFGICLFTISSICAQQKKYITYTVKKGESIRKIAKRYDVKSKDISRLNPGVKRRPKINTVILIPNVNYKEDKVFITPSQIHVVQPKETLFGIAKKYNVSIDALKGANPTLRIDGLKIGMFLEIPNNKLVTKEELLENQIKKWAEIYELHTVVKDDTFYNLTRNYKVTKAQLKDLNPPLIDGLKLGMVLKIKEKVKEELSKTLIEELLVVEKELDSISVEMFADSIVYGSTINVGMILPFKFTKNDTLTKEELFDNRASLVNAVTDFYLGAEMAIDSLRKQGVTINLDVFDSEKSRDSIQELFDLKVFEDKNVVFGPIFNQFANMVATELKDIPVIYPFYSSKQKSFYKGNLVKTATEKEYYENLVIKHFKETHINEHVLIVGDKKITTKKKMLAIAENLKQSDSINEVSFLQPEDNYIDRERFVAAVDTLGVNWVLLVTNDNGVTSEVVNNLKSLPNDPKVKLFAFEKGSNFDKVDNNTLAAIDFTYASSTLLNDSIPEVSYFFNQYLKKNNTYPSKRAVRGFDVVYDVLVRMASDKDNSFKASYKLPSKRIENSFFYDKKLLGGPSYNKAIYLLKYNEDLSIEILKKLGRK